MGFASEAEKVFLHVLYDFSLSEGLITRGGQSKPFMNYFV